MSTPKKPRSDSPLKTLPAARQDAIADYARDHSLVETVAWLKADGLQTSKSAVSDFLSWRALQIQLRQNSNTVETLLAELSATNPDWTPDQIQQAGQAFFTALALEKQDPRQWFLNQQLALKREQLNLDSRKLAILEKKAAAYDRAQAALTTAKNSTGGLTPETIAKIERELKLL